MAKVQPEVGKRYYVRTVAGAFRGKYLGVTIHGELQFDLRPDYGTTTVKYADISVLEATTKVGP